MSDNITLNQMYNLINSKKTNVAAIISPSNILNNHFTNIEIKGNLIGIQKIEKMSYKLYPFPQNDNNYSKDHISIPFPDFCYSFYVEIPTQNHQNLTFRISPSVKEGLSYAFKTDYYATIDIQLIKNKKEIPTKENFYLYPRNTVEFKLTQKREDADFDILEFVIDNETVVTVRNSSFSAYMFEDFSHLSNRIVQTNTTLNTYDAEISNYLNKIDKKQFAHGNIYEINNSICKGSFIGNVRLYFVIETIKNSKPSGNYFSIGIEQPHSHYSQHIEVKPYLSSKKLSSDFADEEVILSVGKSNIDNHYYYCLIISGNIVAFSKLTHSNTLI